MTAIVGWATIQRPWPDDCYQTIEPFVPARQFAEAMRFQRWEDRQARLLGRLILRNILRRQHVSKGLEDIETTPAGRPYIRGSGDFSIAHTRTLVLCAWVGDGRVGIDVETSRPQLNVDDILPWMCDDERRSIAAAPRPMAEALRLWTAKEAVCKADGCGIASGDLPNCSRPEVLFRGRRWRVRSLWRHEHAVSIARPSLAPAGCRTFRLRIGEEMKTLPSLRGSPLAMCEDRRAG